MAKDNHLDRIKAVKRVSRIETGGPIHADKAERRVRRMGTKEWLEEADDDEEFLEDDDHGPFESDLDSTKIMVVCSLCGNHTLADAAHLHQGKLIGECCWDERLRTTE